MQYTVKSRLSQRSTENESITQSILYDHRPESKMLTLVTEHSSGLSSVDLATSVQLAARWALALVISVL